MIRASFSGDSAAAQCHARRGEVGIPARAGAAATGDVATNGALGGAFTGDAGTTAAKSAVGRGSLAAMRAAPGPARRSPLSQAAPGLARREAPTGGPKPLPRAHAEPTPPGGLLGPSASAAARAARARAATAAWRFLSRARRRSVWEKAGMVQRV